MAQLRRALPKLLLPILLKCVATLLLGDASGLSYQICPCVGGLPPTELF